MKKIAFFIIAVGAVIFSCKKNDSGTGQPVITQVRLVDTTKKDSTFTEAVPGTLIVIEGNNFSGLQAVFFNDTSAYFNPSYVTNTNIILTIPASAQTAATDPNVPSVIKLVTSHGTVTYPFKLYLLPPSVSSISFDNSGTVVYINGYNFAGIQKITFPVAGTDTALSYTVNKTFTQIIAAIPPGAPFNDSLRVYCKFGTGAYSYPPPMNITSVSNENGAPGTTITINGTNFVGISNVIFPGNISGTGLQVTSVNQLTVTVPPGITTTDSLRLSGVLGAATSPQLFDSYITHPSPGYLSTFEKQGSQGDVDNTSFIGWTGGYADQAAAAATYPGATGAAAVLSQGISMSANAGPTSLGNAGLLQLLLNPWVSNTSLSINGYSLKFEVYVKTAWSAGEIWISVGDWYAWKDAGNYTARYAPWTDPSIAPNGKYQPTGWITATIPLSQFITNNEFYKTSWDPTGSPASLFSDYKSTGIVFMIANDQASAVPANSINLAIDNVRIVKGE